MQKIILCPRCRVQVKRDNLGELLCPSCNARLCPKAHIFDGKICQYCGWEDPNYSLWQKAQKDRLHRPQSRMPEETETKAQYVCPNCGVNIGSIQKNCPNCGWLGAKSGVAKAAPTGAVSVPVKSGGSSKPILDSIPREPAVKRATESAKSTFVKELSGAERTQWHFPPLKQFVRPVLVSTFTGIIIIGLVFGGIYAVRFVRQNIIPGIMPPSTAVMPEDNHGSDRSITHTPISKTYTLSTNIVPEAAGNIVIVPPSSGSGTFEQGSRVTLTAVPGNCHTFSYWDGVTGSSDNVDITMDSNKSITAYFRPKDATPPVISEVKADCNSDISATITWLTDKPATGLVDYGKTRDFGLTTMSNEELTTSHKVRMTGLEPGTTYYFMVKSADECGNEASQTKMLATLREITVGEREGERALDFTLPYYNDDNPESPNKGGKTETLSTYTGKKKIMLNFWSTYCGACIGEFPFIRGIYEDTNFADRNSENADFLVLTVCIDSKMDEAPSRIKTLEGKFSEDAGPFTFPILFDSVGQTKKDLHIWTIPETIFIDSDGIIREVKIGRFLNIEEIEDILKSLN
ncbi:MAG: redoxin domain-containing protein [Dehalococcoidia bacterium]|nr:redoxin domain-containing protein [Dehalococcoidia bacterium]